MDTSRQNAITSCGRCGQPEDAHKHKTGTDPEDIETMSVLGGPCSAFVVSDAAVIYLKRLAITDNRAPRRRPGGPIPKRGQICGRCGHRGHPKEKCPL
jgi:hypothetical protein